MTHTRRAIVTGLAALPASAAASASVLPADPIFAAISRYRHACAQLVTIDELINPASYAAAEAEVCASSEALFAVRPATLAGAAALARLFVEDDQDHLTESALTSLSEALPQLTV